MLTPALLSQPPSPGQWWLVTDRDVTDDTPAISPTVAAAFVQAGAAVALVDEHAPRPRQWLYLPPPRTSGLVDELYDERFRAGPVTSLEASTTGGGAR